MADQSKFTVTNRSGGHAHVRIAGTYEGEATRAEVEKEFFRGYFGGREAWVRPSEDGKGGTWGCVVHTD